MLQCESAGNSMKYILPPPKTINLVEGNSNKTCLIKDLACAHLIPSLYNYIDKKNTILTSCAFKLASNHITGLFERLLSHLKHTFSQDSIGNIAWPSDDDSVSIGERLPLNWNSPKTIEQQNAFIDSWIIILKKFKSVADEDAFL